MHPDQFTVKAASVKGGALIWIEYYMSRGGVTRDQFLEFFTTPLAASNWAEDVLSELQRTGLVAVTSNGHLSPTQHAPDWVRQARVGKRSQQQFSARAHRTLRRRRKPAQQVRATWCGTNLRSTRTPRVGPGHLNGQVRSSGCATARQSGISARADIC